MQKAPSLERVPLLHLTNSAASVTAGTTSSFKRDGLVVSFLAEMLLALHTGICEEINSLGKSETANCSDQELDELVFMDSVHKATNPGEFNHHILECTADVPNAASHHIVSFHTDSSVKTKTGQRVNNSREQQTEGSYQQSGSDTGPDGGVHLLVELVELLAVQSYFVTGRNPLHAEKVVGVIVSELIDHLHCG